MRIWPGNFSTDCPSLHGSEGELISISVRVEPRLLEQLLETLAQLPFPIHPQIYHLPGTIVEFPAYASWLGEVRDSLKRAGFGGLDVRPMFHRAHAAGAIPA